MDPSLTCCFSGHRDVSDEDTGKLKIITNSLIRSLVEKGFRTFKVGGALGFDTIAAQSVLKIRSELPDVRLILIAPYKDQAEKWSLKNRKEYERIKSSCDSVIYASSHYFRGCMQKRDRELVNGSDLCVCYLKKDSGGTFYTVRYAKKLGVKIINLALQLS